MAKGEYTPWSTVRPLFPTPLPSWVAGLDQERVAAYQVYDMLYWNVPDSFKLVQRGTEANPIYIPSGRTIIEACNRYLAKGFGWAVNPLASTTEDQALIRASFRRLFARERMKAKFNTLKRNHLVRGDGLWHIVADPARPAGSRISIYELHPGSYFPIYDPNDIERVIGCHIVDPYESDGKSYVRRQTYRKVVNGETVTITSELALFDPSAWDDRDGEEVKLAQQLKPATPLPPAITAIPVYHMRNQTVNDKFGSSEMRGLERVFAAVNQGISDEELALALDGLGVYVTTSGPPVDDDGNELDWVLGPGRVVEIDPEADMKRLGGVDSVDVMQEHLKFLVNSLREASGTPDIAVGSVDVSVAQSGIALSLQMNPILSKNEEKEDELLAVHDNMFYDLVHGWFPAYEGINVPDVEVSPVVEPALPVDRTAIIGEIVQLLGTTPPLISAAYARQLLADRLGYEFPEEMGADVMMEMMAMAEASGLDTFRDRLESELGTPVESASSGGGSASTTGVTGTSLAAPSAL